MRDLLLKVKTYIEDSELVKDSEWVCLEMKLKKLSKMEICQNYILKLSRH